MFGGRESPASQQATHSDDTAVQTLDALIESERKLYDAYVARCSAADTRAAGVLTAVLAVGTVTVAASRSVHLRGVSIVVAVAGYALLALAVAFAALRVRAGLKKDPDEFRRRNFGRLLSVQSPRTKQALDQLRGFGLAPRSGGVTEADRRIDPIEVRLCLLEFWRARADDAHRVAIGYDRATVPAMGCLALGVVCLAALGLLLIL